MNRLRPLMFAVCIATAVSPLLAAQTPGPTPQTTKNKPTCLKPSQRARYTVIGKPVTTFSKNYSKAEFTAYLNAAGTKSGAESTKQVVPAGTLDDVGSVFIDGLARFIERRARAELRQWLIDRIHKELCHTESKAFFPSTCALKSAGGGSYLSIDRAYETLVHALRDDIRQLPACAIYVNGATDGTSPNPLGYLLESVYRQYSRGHNLDTLLTGLAKNNAFTGASVCRFSVGDNGDLSATPGCSVVIPVLAYHAALQAKAFEKQHKKPDMVAHVFLHHFLEQLEQHNNLAPLKGRIAGKLGKDGHATETALSRLIDDLDVVYYKREQIKAQLKALKTGDLKRDEAVERLMDINRLLLGQIHVLTTALGSLDVDYNFSSRIELADGLLETYNAIQAHEYVRAVARFRLFSDDLLQNSGGPGCDKPEGGNKSGCELQRVIDGFNRVGGAVASLAEAKDAGDFADRLDTLASPIGAWKLRHESNLFSVNAYGGISATESRYTVPGQFEVTNTEVAAFAPIGLQWTWNHGGVAHGPFLSLIDLGTIIREPESIAVNGGRIGSDVESDFSNVFSPGVYWTLAPWREAPITFGLGASWGPHGYREFETADGEMLEVDRELSWGMFMAVDIVLFPL